MNRFVRIAKSLAGPAMIVTVLFAGWTFRRQLFPQQETAAASEDKPSAETTEKQTVLEISEQARKNLSLTSKPARPQSYWRTVVIPGEVADRPGLSDRGVTSPAVGVVTAIHAFPGDTMRPGQPLFTLRLFSEYLQATQTQLFKARQETSIVQAEIERLSGAVSTGAVSRSKMIELESEISRQNTLIQAARQELLTRGLTPDQVQQIESGTFVSTVDVVAPPVRDLSSITKRLPTPTIQQVTYINQSADGQEIAYEVQELTVELGQQVQAGQLLASLSNHQMLYVVGHAFKREAAFLEQAAQENRPIEIEFAEDQEGRWPELEQTFYIRHLSNSIDTNSRTFDFFVPLTNQSRLYGEPTRAFLVWRFRPGQRARIHVPVEKFDDVFVVPSEAVVREGPEAYVFRQNGDLFKQIPVHVLHEDRRSVVIANDGNITSGSFLAQGSAASLNRVLKSQSASGQQPGVHVHADGTVHAAH
ncbi:efflux RND transporter periplasmic adaptor subunit [Neorhodopirellula pilleata]|uniref:HlyD family secretion protein n=1 Tax=Neorhodopirellula pilleata TaxID=2714738 RepID=A0A5C6A6H1_9BACT|nr:efflux RND transporter periplasmic adaptor subunit [Neorhodopirellula pilleata]TWT95572.1 HlyD family secretion protein [Neorhodopirellula pilleata]